MVRLSTCSVCRITVSVFLVGDIILNAVLKRDPRRPLITVANHHACETI